MVARVSLLVGWELLLISLDIDGLIWIRVCHAKESNHFRILFVVGTSIAQASVRGLLLGSG